jgi:predicted methyltransferase
LLFAVFLIPLSAHADSATATATATVARALVDPRRPAEQLRLDPARKPAQLIVFAQLKRGDKVADFMPGNAYFTRIMSDVVGNTGHVYAFLPTEQLANCSPQEVAGTRLLEHDPGYANVSILSDSAASFRVPQKLDLIWTAQNYHDLHDNFMGPADVAAINKKFFAALKPGGIYLVIDHVADSTQRATRCAILRMITKRRCSTPACAAEPTRSSIGSASPDDAGGLARNLLE